MCLSEATSRRSTAIVISIGGLLLVLLALHLSSEEGSAATVKVPDDHPTIQEALDVAKAYDTVQVKFGTYDERIRINKPITLSGSVQGDTVITSSKAGAIVTLYSSGITIKDITIRGETGSQGIAGSLVMSCAFLGVTIEGCDEGISVRGGYNLVLDRCHIVSSRYAGLHVNGSIEDDFSRLFVSGSVFESNTGTGIDLWNCRRVELDDLAITNNGRWGVFAYKVTEAHIRNSTLSNNLVGLKLERSHNWKVEDNTISRNHWEGVELNMSGAHGTNELRRNQINYNSRQSGTSAAAISFVGKDASENLVEENHLEHNPVGFSFRTDEQGCWDNEFYLNVVSNCVIAVTEAIGTGPNLYWLNVFKDNGRQASGVNEDSWFSNNQLGNYWSDYTLYYGDATPMGLVWSEPYLVDRGGEVLDEFPLVYPYEDDRPAVNLGDDRTVDFGVTETISVWATDKSGIMSYEWTISPPGGYSIFLDRNTWQVEYAFKAIGEFGVTVTVTDHWGLWASDSIRVWVVDRLPPVAYAGPDLTVDLGTAVVLDGSLSSDNQGIGSIHWVFDTNGEQRTYREPILSLTMDELGVFISTLFVVDYSGNTASDTVVIHVKDLSPPVAVALADTTASLMEEATFDARKSRDNVGIVDYRWTLTKGPYVRVYKGPLVSHVFLETGRYTLDLRVADEAGHSDIDQILILVIDTEPPVASAGPDADVPMGTEVHFDASGSTDNVGITQYTWTFFYKADSRTLEGRKVIWRFEEPGEYHVTLMVFDGTGNFASDDLRVTVRDSQQPLALFAPLVDVRIGTSVLLDASRSTDNEGVVTYQWRVSYQDAVKTFKGVMVDYPIEGPGIYKVELTVWDAAGNEDTESTTFQVEPRASTAETPGWLVPGMVAAVAAAVLVGYVFARRRYGSE